MLLKWRKRRLLLLLLVVCALLACVGRKKSPPASGQLSVPTYRRTERELLEGELSQTAATVMVCLILTADGNATLDQSVRLLNHAYMPAGVQLHLAVLLRVSLSSRLSRSSRRSSLQATSLDKKFLRNLNYSESSTEKLAEIFA
jgi:hypothetical protein